MRGNMPAGGQVGWSKDSHAPQALSDTSHNLAMGACLKLAFRLMRFKFSANCILLSTETFGILRETGSCTTYL